MKYYFRNKATYNSFLPYLLPDLNPYAVHLTTAQTFD